MKTLETGRDCESHDLLENVNESPSLQTGIYCAFGRVYKCARTRQTSSMPDFSASNTFHQGGFSGRGTWNLLAAAYTTPHATTSLLNRTHKVVRKLLHVKKKNEIKRSNITWVFFSLMREYEGIWTVHSTFCYSYILLIQSGNVWYKKHEAK